MNILKPWGKISFSATNSIENWQPLVEHCGDVAEVFAAILQVAGTRRRLARLAGRDELDATVCARLAVLAYLHDLGKVNTGFQARSDPGAPRVGHIKPLAAIFGEDAPEALCIRAVEALRMQELMTWGEALTELFRASVSHHGRPWLAEDRPAAEERHWQEQDGYDPLAALSRLMDSAFTAFPSARDGDAPSLPNIPGFVHAFAGLVQISDWIASGDWTRAPAAELPSGWAQRRLREIGLDASAPRHSLAVRNPDFPAAFGFPPREAQSQTAAADGHLVILESETGSGKTEAALWRFVTLFQAGEVDGLYFALPTRTAAVQLHGRVEKLVERLWPEGERPAVVLAVPGYLDGGNTGALPIARDAIDAAELDSREPSVWASQHPKRYFAATISVGSIDQALLGAIRVKHAHMRAAMLMRHLLVVDEVHASDAFMRRILMNLLRDHLAAGGHALLLSATLGAEARTALLCEAAGVRARDASLPSLEMAIATPYPLITSADGPRESALAPGWNGRSKNVAMVAAELLDDGCAIARTALDAARQGAKVLVLRNTVAGAVEVQRELEALCRADSPVLFSANGTVTLHHGRFARDDRRLLDRRVEEVIGKTRPPGGLVLTGTQTLEQSLDIDADFLITDLCPADVLLQRIGRLHRHSHDGAGAPRVRAPGYETPRCLVLTPADGLASFLVRRRPGGKSRHGLGGFVYPDLTILEATLRLVSAVPVWTIPAMNRELVEKSLHSAAIAHLLDGMQGAGRSDWHRHWQEVSGKEAAKAMTAEQGALRRDQPFRASASTKTSA